MPICCPKNGRSCEVIPYNSNKTGTGLLLVAGLILGMFILWLSFIASITWGAADIAFSDIYQAFTAFDGSTNHQIIRTVRLPRSLIAILVGASKKGFKWG